MKTVYWIGTSLDDVRAFPEDVKSEIAYALHLAELGDKSINLIPMVGFGISKVLECVIDDASDAYRAVYTVQFRYAIYVLHAFETKVTTGSVAPKPDSTLIRKRLHNAEIRYREQFGQANRKDVQNDSRA